MPQARATAQQAIEVLKVHQLRKENVIIFEEVKHLRGEVTSRQDELNDALRQIADLKTQLRDVVDKTGEYDRKLEALSLATGRVDNDVADLRRDHEQAKQDLTNKLEAQRTTAQSTDAATEKLREEIVQLRKQTDDSENKTANTVDDMNHDLNAKAEQQDVIELGERLDQLIDDLELRLRTHESVSRVSDTAEQLAERTSGKISDLFDAMTTADATKIMLCQATISTTIACGNRSLAPSRLKQMLSKKMKQKKLVRNNLKHNL